MTIYIILLSIIVITNIVLEKKNTKALFFVFLCIFLVSALRAPSVGRDFPGYIREYELTKTVPFWNFKYVYFEKGFILFMKICAWLGLSNQAFTALISFIIIAPIYYFIRKYSNNYSLSALIYVCYQLYEFDLTGIRQAMAMSICLIAFIIAVEKKKNWLMKYICVVAIATFIHRGSFAVFFALPMLFVSGIMKATLFTGGATLAILAGRSFLLSYIKDYFQKGGMDASASLYIGSNFLFLLFWAIVFVWMSLRIERDREKIALESCDNDYWVDASAFEMISAIYLLSIPFSVLFGTDTAARSSMYATQVIIVLLPNVVNLFTQESKKAFNLVCILFFIVFFITNTLIPNNFDIVPYVFYWDALF